MYVHQLRFAVVPANIICTMVSVIQTPSYVPDQVAWRKLAEESVDWSKTLAMFSENEDHSDPQAWLTNSANSSK